MQIVLTSAVVEETLFAAGAGVLLFKIFYYVFSAIFGPGQGTRLMAEITSSVVIAGFFAILHVGVYGFATVIMAILFTNRLVYQMAYYRTRNIMLSTLMHLLNNYMALAFSIMMLGG
jgi:membrane protease YdiL (CAAX protease family)